MQTAMTRSEFGQEFSHVRAGTGKTLSVAGDIYTILAESDDTGGAFSLVEVSVLPQAGPPLHLHHREDEAFYVLAGEFSFQVDEHTLKATAGDYVYLMRETRHTLKNVGTAPGALLVWMVPAGLERFLDEVGVRLKNKHEPPVPFSDAELQKLLLIAPKYGLEIQVSTT